MTLFLSLQTLFIWMLQWSWLASGARGAVRLLLARAFLSDLFPGNPFDGKGWRGKTLSVLSNLCAPFVSLFSAPLLVYFSGQSKRIDELTGMEFGDEQNELPFYTKIGLLKKL